MVESKRVVEAIQARTTSQAVAHSHEQKDDHWWQPHYNFSEREIDIEKH
jgi:hypothetical protein